MTAGWCAFCQSPRQRYPRRGAVFGLFYLLTGLALLLASVISGGLWDVAGYQGTFLMRTGFAALTLLGLVLIRAKLVIR